MAKKQQALTNKLGSWTDQANQTRNQPPSPVAEAPSSDPPSASTPGPSSPVSAQERYRVARGLIDRIADVAAQQHMSQHEVIGYLLTWALDQVEAGLHTLPTANDDEKSTTLRLQ